MERVTVVIDPVVKDRLIEIVGLLGSFDFIPILMDRTEGRITGYAPNDSLDLLRTVAGVVSIEQNDKADSLSV